MKTSWKWDHLNVTVQARAIKDGSTWVAYVNGPEDKVPTGVAFDAEERAKARAEELLMEAYPHDCSKKTCDSSWKPFAKLNPPKTAPRQ